MKYQLKNIGRDKISRVINVNDKYDVLKEVKKHLMSNDIEMVPNNDDTGWIVFAGIRQVGEVLDIKEG